MKTGEVIREFVAKDDHRVILRTLKWEDLDDLLKFFNLLVEKADILKAERRNLMHGGRGRWTFGDQFRNYKRAGY